MKIRVLNNAHLTKFVISAATIVSKKIAKIYNLQKNLFIEIIRKYKSIHSMLKALLLANPLEIKFLVEDTFCNSI